MPRICFASRLLVPCLLCASALCSAVPAPSLALPPARSKEPKWIRVNSAHFSVLTDAGEDKGRETVTRIEQMRDGFAQLFRKTKLHLPEPLELIAVRSDEEYIRLAPLRQGRPISAPGFFLAGEDRNFIVLDLAAEDSWRAVSREFARLLLNFNYPPTQDWFDEGFAQYFSSLRLVGNQAQMGGDPIQNLPWEHALPGRGSAISNPPKSFVELLRQPWLPIAELFMMRSTSPGSPAMSPMFYAQSWIVMHYLLNQNKLSEAGTYFGLVEIQKLPLEQAIQQAFGVNAAQLEQAVKDYFHSLSWSPPPPANAKVANATAQAGSAYQLLPVLEAGQIGSSVLDITDAQAQALVAEVMVRLPEHRDQGEKDLQAVIDDPKTDNAIAHRGLAWTHLEKKEFNEANEELARAMELDGHDPWVRYYAALVKFKTAQTTRKPIQGVSNLIQDLVSVLDWNPDFAEAHNMLAMGRLAGGGVHAATDSIRVAIQLSPRNQQYLLNLAQIDLAGKKWDDATTLLERLKNSLNPEIAKAARKSLADLPTLKKYGVLPQPGESSPTTAANSPKTPPQRSADNVDEESSSEENPAAVTEPIPDRRKVLFLKGKLINVDCRQSPAAILTIRSGTRTFRLRTDNYKSLLLVGADEFSCEWMERPVVANYKAGGKADGDLVSVEVQ
jgi:tetratricopeptide (TPR) repeat protein